MPMRDFEVDRLHVTVFNDRVQLGLAAGNQVAAKIRELQKTQTVVRIVFAAAPSQNEFLETLVQAEGLDWDRIIAFHLDDYLKLPDDAPQRFRNYLKEHIFSFVKPAAIHFIESNQDSVTECERYSKLLIENPLDIACIGIGENGHLAFNDPPVADFFDPELIKVVKLEESCRIQQVNDGCFGTLAAVPTHAFTLTIPTILSARQIFCMVPGKTKAEAVKATLHGEIGTNCPASILRRHMRASLFIDSDSAALL